MPDNCAVTPELLLDLTALPRLLGDDPVTLARFSSRFVETTAVSVAAMHSALDDGDVETVGRLAHSLKSAAATVGAMSLATLADELEATCLAGDIERISAECASISTLVDEVAALLINAGKTP